MSETKDYIQNAVQDARYCALNYLDEIVDQLMEEKEASDDLLNDYTDGDSYHHEYHVDNYYSLQEAAELLDQLSKWEETDHGLWNGLEPRRAIECQAAYTYGNAVHDFWQQLIEEINSDGIVTDMIGEDDPASREVLEQRVKEIIEEFKV